jgi:PAS domain-containing protein
VPDAVVVIDLRGVIVRRNLAYDALLLTRGGEFVLMDQAGQALPVDARPQMRAARGESRSLVFTLRLTDGSTRWYDARVDPSHIRLGGGAICI